jgi:hypothetical protein
MLDSRQTVSEPQAKDVKVYSFAAKVRYPEDAENIQLQLSLSHEHRNKLTELVLANRKVYRQLVKNHCGVDLEALETQRDAILSEITELKTAINQWKMEERTRKTNPELATKLKELSAQLKPIREAIKEVKTRAKEDPELASALEQNEQDLKEEIKATRKHFSRERGIYWPNYMRNEEATNQARFQPFDPKFHRWTGEGSLAIQLQGGMSVPELLGKRANEFDPAARDPDLTKLFVEMFGLVMPEKVPEEVVKRDVKTQHAGFRRQMHSRKSWCDCDPT